MVFSSAVFLFIFLPLTLLVYYVAAPRFRNCILLFASLFFYSWGEPKNVFIMILSIIANYVFALLISRLCRRKLLQNIIFVAAILFNVGLLFYFKYVDFAIKNLNSIFNSEIRLRNIALPIGISFFTFQILSYVIDVKRQKVPVQKNILNLGLYISFFPQLIAGPIVRYIDVNEQINNRKVDIQKFSAGCLRFMSGFSKKILIADQLSPYVDKIFSQHGISAPSAWLGIVAYTLQIYFDFSGYSDMAIGLGKMFGFDFLENFNYPYIAKSVKDFWRRWHISLSQWFRDYVYIPLGGNRVGKVRVFTNLLVVWFLTGFWHGASWNFIFWGLYYFTFLMIERLPCWKKTENVPAALKHLYSVFVIMFGWILFREAGARNSLKYIRNLFVFNADSFGDLIGIADRKFFFCILIGVALSMPIVPYLKLKFGAKAQTAISVAVCIVFVVAISFLLGTGFSPFLYFRF